jgi:hypothetical protein
MVCTTMTEGDEDTVFIDEDTVIAKVSATDGEDAIKLIDFDASAKIGEPCHLKFR